MLREQVQSLHSQQHKETWVHLFRVLSSAWSLLFVIWLAFVWFFFCKECVLIIFLHPLLLPWCLCCLRWSQYFQFRQEIYYDPVQTQLMSNVPGKWFKIEILFLQTRTLKCWSFFPRDMGPLFMHLSHPRRNQLLFQHEQEWTVKAAVSSQTGEGIKYNIVPSYFKPSSNCD